MNRFAYRTTGLAVKTLSNFFKARLKYHGTENLPAGAVIFVINHFTRIETLLMPYHLHRLTQMPIWSLAHSGLFVGALGSFLEKVGAVSTKNPDRDRLIVKSLLTGEASWIIFPEGRMVKSKKIIEKGRFMVSYAGGKHPPHTGAATLALRAEFYRQRIQELTTRAPEEASRLMKIFNIDSVDAVSRHSTTIVPVNITYFPIRARENTLSSLAQQLVEKLPDRAIDEIMTEGTMLLSGVDMDIRFGEPIRIAECVACRPIRRDIVSKKRIEFDDALPSRRRMRKEALKIMQRYMAAIYRMTTVNYDHLFASVLKHMPFAKLNSKALKRKVFLVSQTGLSDTNIHLHSGLRMDRTHLLADDCYNRYGDFLSLALDIGVVNKDGPALIKDHGKFATAFDFNRARMDNPVAVIANEVEPLRLLQRHVRRIAWTPDFWVRRKVAAFLMKQAYDEFQEDYQAFYIDGESKKKSVGMPYLVKGSPGNIGVVLIHGYMAAPMEMKALAEYLGRKGLWVYVPCLKGHGTAPEDLGTRTFKDWTASVDRGYAIISSLCDRVVVGGFSNGAGLALDLASRIDDIIGVFAVSPPMQLQDLSAKFVPAVGAWNRLMDMVHIEEAKKEFVENRPENPHINYLRNPLSGVMELVKLMESIEPKLKDIRMPAFVVQAMQDPVVNPEGTEKIFKSLGSKDKTYLLFNLTRHGILLGEGAHRVHRSIYHFIEDLR